MRTGIRSSLFFAIFSVFAHGARASAETFEQRARDATEVVSDEVQDLAEKVDIMLAGKRYSKEPNNTRVNLSQLVTFKEGGEIDKSTDVGVNLRLPNVEKRWQARFSTYDEEQEDRDMQQRRVRTTPRARDPGASLFFLRKLGDVSTSFQPKLQLNNPLQMSYVLKLQSHTDFKPIRITPELQLFTDAINGAGEYFSLGFERKLTEKTMLHFDNEEEYHENGHAFTTRHGLATDYSLSDMQALGASFIVGSANHNFHLDTMNLSASYAQEVYKDLLKYMISPFIGFAYIDRFKGKVGITFTLTVIF